MMYFFQDRFRKIDNGGGGGDFGGSGGDFDKGVFWVCFFGGRVDNISTTTTATSATTNAIATAAGGSGGSDGSDGGRVKVGTQPS